MRYNVKYSEPTVLTSMRLPHSLVQEVKELAKINKQSFSYMTAYLIQEGLTTYNKEKPNE